MAIKASGEITIVDLFDNKELSIYLTSNLPKTQKYDATSKNFVPNWESENLTITPNISLNQMSIPLNSSGLTISFKRRDGSSSETSLITGENVNGGILTINKNVLDESNTDLITYICYVTYLDGDQSVNTQADMTFSLVENGVNGKDGEDGKDGEPGKDGTDGKDGTSITIVERLITYQIGESGTETPSGSWSPTIPALEKGKFLWTKNYIKYSDNSEVTSYSVSYIAQDGQNGEDGQPGKDGAPGKDGEDGKDGTSITIISRVVDYQKSANGSTIPTGVWETDISKVVVNNGEYLWTRTIVTYSDGSSTEAYSVGYKGTNGQDGTNGTNGISITKVEVEYYVSEKSDELVGGEWSIDTPTWENGKYIWSRTKTTLSNNTSITTEPACITGAKGEDGKDGTNGADGKPGEDGAPGRGIESITTEFYLSTSKNQPENGEWEEEAQLWESGKYIWTRSKIVYINPSSIEYTEPQCDSSWEAVNELQIGAKNLILGSNFTNIDNVADRWVADVGTKHFATGDLTYNTYMKVNLTGAGEISTPRVYYVSENLWEENQTYAISFLIKLSTVDIEGNAVTPPTGVTIQASSNAEDYADNTLPLTTSWQLYKGIIKNETISSTIENLSFHLNKAAMIDITHIKLEKGNKVTDWTIAPEDLEEQIAATDNKINAVNTDIMNILYGPDGTSGFIGTTNKAIDDVKGTIELYNEERTAEYNENGEKIRDLESFVSKQYLTGSTFGFDVSRKTIEKGVNLVKNSVMKQHKNLTDGGIQANFWLNGNDLKSSNFPNISYGDDASSRAYTDCGSYFSLNLDNNNLDFLFSDPIDLKQKAENLLLSYKLRKNKNLVNNVFFIGLVFYKANVTETDPSGMGDIGANGLGNAYYIPIKEYTDSDLASEFKEDYIYKRMPISAETQTVEIEEVLDVTTVRNQESGVVESRTATLSYIPSSAVNIIDINGSVIETVETASKTLNLSLEEESNSVWVKYSIEVNNFVETSKTAEEIEEEVKLNPDVVSIYYANTDKKIWVCNPFQTAQETVYSKSDNVYVNEVGIDTVRVVIGTHRNVSIGTTEGEVNISDLKFEYDTYSTIWVQGDSETYTKQYKMDEKGFSISTDTNTMFIDEDEIAAYKIDENGSLDPSPTFQIKEDKTILRKTVVNDDLIITNDNGDLTDDFAFSHENINGTYYLVLR